MSEGTTFHLENGSKWPSAHYSFVKPSRYLKHLISYIHTPIRELSLLDDLIKSRDNLCWQHSAENLVKIWNGSRCCEVQATRGKQLLTRYADWHALSKLTLRDWILRNKQVKARERLLSLKGISYLIIKGTFSIWDYEQVGKGCARHWPRITQHSPQVHAKRALERENCRQ